MVAVGRLGGKLKYNIETFKEAVAIKNPNVEILATEYIGTFDEYDCRCRVCNILYRKRCTSILQGDKCDNCHRLNNIGENSPNWKGGITTVSQCLRRSIIEWKRDTEIAYNFRCDITGSNDYTVHHLYNFSDIVKEVMSTLDLPVYEEIEKYSKSELRQMKNLCIKLHSQYGLGVCMSTELHSLFHSKYGNRNNTVEQYNEFKALRYDKICCK